MAIISPDEDGIVGDRRGRKPKSREENKVFNSSIVISGDENFSCDDFIKIVHYRARQEHKRITPTISEYTSRVFGFISASNIIYQDSGKNDYGIVRSFVGIGALSLCIKYKILVPQAENVIKMIRKSSDGKEDAEERIRKAIKNFEASSETKARDSDEILNTLSYYCSNEMVRSVFNSIYKSDSKISRCNIGLSSGLVSACNELLEKELLSNACHIKSGCKNTKLQTRIPVEIYSFVLSLNDQVFDDKLPTDVLRLCFIHGMRLFAKLIVKNMINFDVKISNILVRQIGNIAIKYDK